MAKLCKAVYVRDPERHRTVLLMPGEEPAPHLAALVTNPDCWEDGKAPGGKTEDATTPKDETPTEGDDSEDTKPAARKTAAKKPARGRTTAAEGTGGQ
ncbi:hypothetical protein [Streptomyces sp. NBC_01422]|uniref:hypothetical protein n=1 Tax=Streptomyces sp. NBC_01422 TaxID=2903859 RepID=UPI002E2C7EDD|nr:hypothetical protein [Streptomyces sp. NBC_01422]